MTKVIVINNSYVAIKYVGFRILIKILRPFEVNKCGNLLSKNTDR